MGSKFPAFVAISVSLLWWQFLESLGKESFIELTGLLESSGHFKAAHDEYLKQLLGCSISKLFLLVSPVSGLECPVVLIIVKCFGNCITINNCATYF